MSLLLLCLTLLALTARSEVAPCQWDCAQCNQSRCLRFACGPRLPCPARSDPLESCAHLVCRGAECVASQQDCAQLRLSTTLAPTGQSPVSTSIVAIITVLLFIGAIIVALIIGGCWGGDDRRH